MLGEALYENIPGGARWRYVSGSALVFAFVTQVVTGFFLWMFYSPSSQTAWESVYYIQHEVQGGWLLRGIHHFMAQAMVVLLGIHLLQVVWDGAYRAPREMNFWIGLVLMFLVLGLALTGYLLPWDQKGYWATNVATNLAVLAPGGDAQRTLAVGGQEYGHLTLTRFFALHAGVLPTLIGVFLAAHLYLFRKHGITALKNEGDADEFFWPKQVFMDAVACLIVLAIVVFRVVLPGILNPSLEPGHWGAELGAPADSSQPYSAARPEWYFLFLFQLLKFFEGGLDAIGAIWIPAGVVVMLFLMPLWGSNIWGHRFNVLFILALLAGAGTLTGLAIYNDNYSAGRPRPGDDNKDKDGNELKRPEETAEQKAKREAEEKPAQAKWDASQTYLRAIEDAEEEAKRFKLIAHHKGIPKTGANALVAEDPVLMGRRIFKRACAACHDWVDPATGKGIHASQSSAPNLYGFASREWLTGIFDPEQIASDKYFGKTKHKAGDMINFVKDDLPGNLQSIVAPKKDKDGNEIKRPEENAEQKAKREADEKKAKEELMQAVVAALSAEAKRGDQVELDAEAVKSGLIAKGKAAILNSKLGCIECHAYGDQTEDHGPVLNGYGSQEWLIGMISDPSDLKYYGGENDRMPSFAKGHDPKQHQLSKHDLDLLARWLRGDYKRYEK
jgi:ubiquinol-cytochrome c reductase cytochrome b subunit